MGFTVDSIEISRALAAFPNRGVWSVRAELVGGKAPAKGTLVTTQLGDLAMVGTVRIAEVYVDRAEVLIVGGRDGWTKTVQRRQYRADNGVRLSLVAGDLAKDAGEVLGPLEEAVLGYGWVRPEGPAGTALEELGRHWYVDFAGMTRIGARPAASRTGLKIGVRNYRPAVGTAELTSPDDILSAFAPGTTISGEGIPQRTIYSSEIRISERSAVAFVRFT